MLYPEVTYLRHDVEIKCRRSGVRKLFSCNSCPGGLIFNEDGDGSDFNYITPETILWLIEFAVCRVVCRCRRGVLVLSIVCLIERQESLRGQAYLPSPSHSMQPTPRCAFLFAFFAPSVESRERISVRRRGHFPKRPYVCCRKYL